LSYLKISIVSFKGKGHLVNLELANKVSLVTGSGRGIGRAIAIKLSQMGAKVAVNDLPESSEAAETVKEIEGWGGEGILAPADITDAASVKAMVNRVTETWGKIDILVNNAGITRNVMMFRMSEDDWDKVIDINLRGAFLSTKYALRSMVGQNWGRIINIASVAGLVGKMGRVNYAASKGGLIAFTRSLACEVGARNITVNAIAPGPISTKLTEELPQEYIDMLLSQATLKRFGTPEEVAELAAFLASNRSGYITGQVINIDGGIT
jgi:3-oxoacyl-[acyl-carrier protein] reductase